MIKYIDKRITFSEIPDETTLCYSISNCDGLCEGCHSPELRGDSGSPLHLTIYHDVSECYAMGITCVCFLGEGAKNPAYENDLIDIMQDLKNRYPDLKLALYSGKLEMNEHFCRYLDYYKIGPYIASCGPLNSTTTNQHLYAIHRELIDHHVVIKKEDITSKFWRTE